MAKKNTMKWQSLQPGDSIAVIAPGFAFPRSYISKTKKIIKDLGYEAQIPKAILGKDLICANSTDKRVASLKSALESKSKVLWAMRGGYGALQLLPYLSKMKCPKSPKLLWGFSDITSLHLFFNQQWNWPSIYGPNLERFHSENAKATELKKIDKILKGEITQLEFKNLKAMNSAAQKAQQIEAKILGGTLSVVASSAGTPWGLKGTSSILFLEEVGERAYRLDRYLNQLEQSGALKSVKAIVFGNFLGQPDKDGKDRTKAYLKAYAKSSKIPVYGGIKVGHGKFQEPLVLGGSAKIISENTIQLICETGVQS